MSKNQFSTANQKVLNNKQSLLKAEKGKSNIGTVNTQFFEKMQLSTPLLSKISKKKLLSSDAIFARLQSLHQLYSAIKFSLY